MGITKNERDYVIKALCGDIYDPKINGIFDGDFAGVEINGDEMLFVFKECKLPFAAFNTGDIDKIREIILKLPNTNVVYHDVNRAHYIICDESYGWRVIPNWISSDYLGLDHPGNDGTSEIYFGAMSFRVSTVMSDYGWKLLRESPVTTIKYTKYCNQKLYDADDDFKKKINEIYDNLSDSDKLLVELGCD